MTRLLKMAEDFLRRNTFLKKWRKVLALMMSVVVFLTTYAMILPAITLEADKSEGIGLFEEETGPVYLDGEELIFENETLRIALTVSLEAQVPADAALTVREIGQPFANDGLDDTGRKDEYLAYLAAAGEGLHFTEEEINYIEETASNVPAADVPWFRYFVLSLETADGAIQPACELPVRITYKNTDRAAADGLKAMSLGADGKMNQIGAETSVADAAEPHFALLASEENAYDVAVKFTDEGMLTFGTFAADQAKIDAAIEAEKAAEDASAAESAEAEPEDESAPESAESQPEAESASEESEKADLTPVTLEAKGADYTVTMTYTSEARIPEGAVLTAAEILPEDPSYRNYINDAAAALDVPEEQTSRVRARFFDIKIMLGENEITPAAPVRVEISYDQPQASAAAESVSAVHFPEEGEKPEVVEIADVTTDAETEEVSGVAFEAGSFSVYGVVYTVDFEWEVDGKTYEFSVPGGGFVSLRALVEALRIADSTAADEFVENVASVEFGSPDLMWVGKAENETTVADLKKANDLECRYSSELTAERIREIDAQTVKAGDWALVSLRPFTTEETLTVTMKNGEDFAIKVTDAQISAKILTADGETFVITVTYGPEAEIPEGAKLEAEEIPVGSKEYQQYYDQSVNAINSDNGLSYARFFDIKIMIGDKIIEPKAAVETKVSYSDELILSDNRDASVVHFAEDGIEVLPVSLEEKDNMAEFVFSQDSFSVTGTVVKGLSEGEYVIYAWPGTQSYQNWNGTSMLANDYFTMLHRYSGYGVYGTYSIASERGQGVYNYGTYHTNTNSDSNVPWIVTPVNGGYTISAKYNNQVRYLSNNNGTLSWSMTPTTWQYTNNKLSTGNYYIRWNNNAFSLTTNSDQATNMYFAWTNKDHNTDLSVHYGELDSNGDFVEWSSKKIADPTKLGSQVDLRTYGGGDSTAESKNYRYVTTRVGSSDGTDIYFRLATEDAMSGDYNIQSSKYWKYREQSDITFDYAGTGWNVFRSFANNEKDIYVVYEPKPKDETVPPGELDPDAPTAEKSARTNSDGTYDITLSVKGNLENTEQVDKANVVIVYDISNSMLRKGVGVNGQATEKTRVEYTEPAIKALAKQLLEMNTAADPDKIELTLVMFAARVCNEKQVNTIYSLGDYDKFENEIDQITYTNGTNWDSGLEAAEAVLWKDNDPVYLVFVSDGDTISRSQLISGKEAEWDGGTYHNNPYLQVGNETVASEADVAAAVSHADKIKQNGKIYSVSAFGIGMSNLDAISTSGDHYDLNESNPNKVFEDILSEIKSEIGYQDIEVCDGITDLSSTTMVSGTADCFTYTITDDLGNKAVVRVNQKGEVFGLAMNPADPSTVTDIADSATVKVAGNGGSVSDQTGSLTYTVENTGQNDANGVAVRKITITVTSGSQKLFEAATTTASYSSSSSNGKTGPKAVEWSLAPLGTLDSRYTYDLTFTVWPKQQAYDILADLNNGLMFYDYASYTASLNNGETPLSEEEAVSQGLVLSQEIRSQIISSGDGYAVKTNTYAGLSYKKVVDGVPSNTKSSEIVDPRQVMGLDESKVSVKKAWDVSLDPVQLTRFLAENPDYQAQLAVKNPEGDSVPVTIKAAPVTEKPDGTYVSQNTKDVYIAPGVMLSEAKAIEKGVDLTKYPALTYKGTTYYLLETGHNYTMEESGSDWHFELDAQVYHPMVVDGHERDVSFTFDQSTGAITGITAIDENNEATLTATNKLRSGVNIIKNVVDENGNDIDDDNTFYVRLTLKDKTGKEIKYSDYMRETDYSVGANVVEKYQVDCGNGDSYWFIRANNGSGGKTYDYYALNADGTGQINGDLFPIWYNDYASYTEQNNVISGVGDWTLDSMWESGEVKAIKKGQLLQLKNVPYGTTVELTEVKPVRDGSGNITGYTDLSINNTFDGYKLLSVEYSHNGESWDKSIDFNNSYKIAVTNQAVGNELYFRKADIASRGETDESRIVKLDGAEFELSRVRDNVSVRLYFDTANDNKVMTQAEVEEKVHASASDADFADKIEAAGISSTFIFNADGSDVSIHLPAGTYKLKEVAPPSGYVITGGEMQFELTNNSVTASGNNISPGTKEGKPLITVYNEPGASLPSTGGPGTTLLTLIGLVLAAFASAVLLMRRRQTTA